LRYLYLGFRWVWGFMPFLYKTLKSLDIAAKEPFDASVERSDICAVQVASYIAGSAVDFEIARSFLKDTG